MTNMFHGANSFNQNLGAWNVVGVIAGPGAGMTDMFNGVALSIPNYNSLLNGWNALGLQNGVDFHGGSSKYCSVATAAHDNLVAGGGHNWTITDGGLSPNCPPDINSDGGASTATLNVAENQTAVTTVMASDSDVGDVVTYSISGGIDQAKFTIVSATGVLTFVNSPDFENPGDADTNNTYIVELRATDDGAGNLFDTQAITVTVTDVAEAVAGGSGGGSGGSFVSTSANDESTNLEGDTSEGEDWDGKVCREFEYVLESEMEVPSTWFSDASSDHPAYEALMSLASQGVVNGSGEEHLANLDAQINRAEVSKIVSIAREDKVMLGSTCEDNPTLADLDTEQWYYGFVKNLQQRKIVIGYPDGSFKPANNTNLAETYKILAISFGLITQEEADAQSELDGSEWYVPYYDVVAEKIEIADFINTAMDAEITRGEFFYLLNELL